MPIVTPSGGGGLSSVTMHNFSSQGVAMDEALPVTLYVSSGGRDLSLPHAPTISIITTEPDSEVYLSAEEATAITIDTTGGQLYYLALRAPAITSLLGVVAGSLELDTDALETIVVTGSFNLHVIAGAALISVTFESGISINGNVSIADTAPLLSDFGAFAAFTGASDFIITGAALSSSSVDAIVSSLAASGVTGGTLNLSGGTSASPTPQQLPQKETYQVTVQQDEFGNHIVEPSDYLLFFFNDGTGDKTYAIYFTRGILEGSAPGEADYTYAVDLLGRDLATDLAIALRSGMQDFLGFLAATVSDVAITATYNDAGPVPESHASGATSTGDGVAINRTLLGQYRIDHAGILALLGDGWNVTYNT